MNVFRYLGVSREEFEEYLQDGRVTESLHKELWNFSNGRATISSVQRWTMMPRHFAVTLSQFAVATVSRE